jgi:hypothetical protein
MQLVEFLTPTVFWRRGISKLLRNLFIMPSSPSLQTGMSIAISADGLSSILRKIFKLELKIAAKDICLYRT